MTISQKLMELSKLLSAKPIFRKFLNFFFQTWHGHSLVISQDIEPYKDSDLSQQKSRKCVFRRFLNRHQKKLFYSLFQNRQKYYESSKTEYSDSTSFINRLTPLNFFLGSWNFFEGLKGGFPQKISTFFCFCLTTID